MVCTQCGIIGADARPSWREKLARPGGAEFLIDAPQNICSLYRIDAPVCATPQEGQHNAAH
jgi:hypothetical protein